MTYQITLGRHQLAFSYGPKRGRPKKPLLKQLTAFVSQLINLATNKRLGGHPVSRVLRRVLENKKFQQVFSLNLVGLVFLTGIFTPSISALTSEHTEIPNLNPAVINLTTQESVRAPLDSFMISQGYHLFHQAIDFKEPAGNPIYPIMPGKVEAVFHQRFGYGNYLIVDHGNGFKSLYAHLQKIVVVENEEVAQDTPLGTIGSTGRATGAHLHLEVYDHGQPFNPLTILQ